MLNKDTKIVALALFAWALVYASSDGYFSYTPPSPIQPILNKTQSINDYQGLIKVQEAFVRNAKTIKPSVVSINKVKEVIENSSWQPKNSNSHSTPWYLKVGAWISNYISGRKYLVESVGSGVILDSDGYILTNYHVIQGLDRILIKLLNGREYFGKVLGYDPQTDLAVLRISTLRILPEPKFGHSENLKVGEWVMAIGNPYGLEGTVTVGIVSGKGRTHWGGTQFESLIQTDASINPGNSGGPLINLDGNIIGINTGVAAFGSGVGFSIPIETALKIANQLVHNGKVMRGWLGVGIQNLTPELASILKFKNTDGVLVNSVELEESNQKEGIKQGDIIIQFDGKPVSNSKYLRKMVTNTKIGRVVSLKVFRDGKEKMLEIRISKLVS
tara:strand:- start:589 stop:1749 length:1161 start_codon:yes stop_codon:yes gene_type:complete